MSMLGRLVSKVTGTARHAERGDRGVHGTGDRNVGGRQGGTAPVPPDLPPDDERNDARNIGG